MKYTGYFVNDFENTLIVSLAAGLIVYTATKNDLIAAVAYLIPLIVILIRVLISKEPN